MTRHVIDFANRSLRNTADRDYIVARAAHRIGLTQPFQWSALQCIEKYLKAILLYSNHSARRIGHDLVEALALVNSIPDMEFRFPEGFEDFIDYLNRHGVDRYLSRPNVLRGDSLLNLDTAVWHIRRYCYNMRGTSKKRDGSTYERLPLELNRVHHPRFESHPHEFRIFNGYLEDVVKRRLESYEALTWKNFYYGRRRKLSIKNVRLRAGSTNPTHALHPEAFSELAKLVDFPAPVRDYYLKRATEAGAGKENID